MAELVIATKNRGKIAELNGLLAGTVSVRALPEHIEEVDETGKTYWENAKLKAETYFASVHCPVLADDSGLEIDALGGEPEVFSARYGGAGLTWPQRWQFVYSKLANHPKQMWTARFRCVLCFFDGKMAPQKFEATVEGLISSEPKGTAGFGYDPIFYCPEIGKTFGEATTEEKQRVSHRSRAVRLFREALPALFA